MSSLHTQDPVFNLEGSQKASTVVRLPLDTRTVERIARTQVGSHLGPSQVAAITRVKNNHALSMRLLHCLSEFGKTGVLTFGEDDYTKFTTEDMNDLVTATAVEDEVFRTFLALSLDMDDRMGFPP